MNINHEGNDHQGVKSRLLIAVFEQLGVFIKLHGRACHPVRLAAQRAVQIIDEFFLVVVLPNVVSRENLHHVFARASDEARMQRRRQVLGLQPAAGILGLDGFKGLPNVIKERLLVVFEPIRH